MSMETVRQHLKRWDREKDVLEFTTSSATVSGAAATLNVTPAQIAKTLSFKGKEENTLIIVTAGDTKIDNKKFRDTFQCKAKMLSPDKVLEKTGHVVGGVCPFGLPENTQVYLDISLQRNKYVYPACGSTNSAIKLTGDELYTYADAIEWIDVAKDWE